MPDSNNCSSPAQRHTPWNKGKLIGAKPPLRPKHVWAIRTRLMIEGRIRDLAMFNLAIDSKLRGCDVGGLQGGRHCAKRLHDRPSKRPAEKDRAASQVRADGSDPSSYRRLSEGREQKTRRIFVHRQTPRRPIHDDEAVRAPRFRLEWQHWAGPAPVRHPLASQNQGDADLSAHWQSPSRAALACRH